MAQAAVKQQNNPAVPPVLTKQVLQIIVRRIVACVAPERIVLFGSHARGDARADSDLDLLVVSHSDAPRATRSAPLYALLSDIPISMDIVFYRPEEIDAWQAVSQAFITTAMREGIVLYEKSRS